MSNLLGGNSKQSSSTSLFGNSSNQAYPALSEQLGSTVDQTGGASNLISQLLGVTSGSEGKSGLDAFRESSGYQDQVDQGIKGITNSAAAHGALDSGATLKAISNYGQGAAKTSFSDYLSGLFNLGNTGVSAANAISGAGGVSNNNSTSSSSGKSKSGLGL